MVNVALNTALRWKLITVNPAEACQLPRLDRKEARALDKAESELLLNAARGHHFLYPVMLLAAATGCRRGELVALTWKDVDLAAVPGTINVTKSLEQTRSGLRVKETKNRKSRRFPLPAIAVQALKDHRENQAGGRRQFGKD